MERQALLFCEDKRVDRAWMNLVERLFAEVTERAIRRGSFNSVPALEAAIRDDFDARDAKPFFCRKTADDILAKVASTFSAF